MLIEVFFVMINDSPRFNLLLTVMALLVALFMCGCTEQVSNTQVSPDGTVVKSITLRETTINSMSGMMGESEESVSLVDKFEFLGDGWTVLNDQDAQGEFLTATKEFKLGDKDVAEWKLKINEKSVIVAKTLVNETAGQFEFSETYSFEGEFDNSEDKKSIEQAKSLLVENWQKGELSDEKAQELAEKIHRIGIRIIFGPSDPIFPHMFSSMSRFEREFKMRAFGEMELLFTGVNQMSESEARAQAKRMLEVWSSAPAVENPGASEQSDEGNDDLSYVFSVSFKSQNLYEHNGRHNPVTDEVYWDFYSMSIKSEPVQLKVIFSETMKNGSRIKR